MEAFQNPGKEARIHLLVLIRLNRLKTALSRICCMQQENELSSEAESIKQNWLETLLIIDMLINI